MVAYTRLTEISVIGGFLWYFKRHYNRNETRTFSQLFADILHYLQNLTTMGERKTEERYNIEFLYWLMQTFSLKTRVNGAKSLLNYFYKNGKCGKNLKNAYGGWLPFWKVRALTELTVFREKKPIVDSVTCTSPLEPWSC